MKYNAEQVAFMLHEAIDENREYKSWHVSTQHLMTLVERVVANEREACAKVCEEQMQGKSIWIEGARACSLAIRARSGDQK